jgi:8-oxo-dGTP diphosphatase
MSIVEYKPHDRFLVAVDCIIFGFDGLKLKALLIKRNFEPEINKWSLMGGFVNNNESVDDAAARVLVQLTGLRDIYMEQIGCFGDIQRDTAARVISIAYFALIKIDEHSEELLAQFNAKWYDLDKVPKLIFDHNKMLKVARERLQFKAASQPIGFELLPKKFTLTQLQNLYEAIFETTFDKRNFTRKIFALGVLQKLDEKEKETSRKGAFYYVFEKAKYKKLQHEIKKFI